MFVGKSNPNLVCTKRWHVSTQTQFGSYPTRPSCHLEFNVFLQRRYTWPFSSTRIWLQSMMVLSRWAIISIVQDLNSFLIVFCIRSSVLTSTAAVASSRTRIFDFLSNALARLSSCLCPTLKFSPPSHTYEQLKHTTIVI